MASLIKANSPGYNKDLDYNIYWANDRGERLMEIEKVLGFNYVKAVQSVGPFEIMIPYEKGFETGRVGNVRRCHARGPRRRHHLQPL